MFMAGRHHTGKRTARETTGREEIETITLTSGKTLRDLRALVVVIGVVRPAADLDSRVPDRVVERVEPLTRDRDRVAVVAGLPHPLTAVAAHRDELDLECRAVLCAVHRASPAVATLPAMTLREGNCNSNARAF